MKKKLVIILLVLLGGSGLTYQLMAEFGDYNIEITQKEKENSKLRSEVEYLKLKAEKKEEQSEQLEQKIAEVSKDNELLERQVIDSGN